MKLGHHGLPVIVNDTPNTETTASSLALPTEELLVLIVLTDLKNKLAFLLKPKGAHCMDLNVLPTPLVTMDTSALKTCVC